MRKKEFTEEEVNKMINLYHNPTMSLQKIGENFGVSRNVIKRVLVEQNVYNPNRKARKYYFNENFFEVIDTEEKAYWLGFIAADGCIVPPRVGTTSGACLKIRLHPKDREHLEKFILVLNSNLVIKDRINTGFSEGQPCIDLEINSIKMVRDLIDKGIVPHKSLILEPPKIDPKFNLHFIRGYFDGDGSIYRSNDIFVFSIVGTESILNWIQKELGTEQKLEKRHKTDICSYFRIGGTNKPYKFLQKIYEHSSVYLERKYSLFKLLQSSIEEIQ